MGLLSHHSFLMGWESIIVLTIFLGGGLCVLVWIGEVGLLWFEQRFCGFAVVWAKIFSLLMKMLSLRAIGEGFWWWSEQCLWIWKDVLGFWLREVLIYWVGFKLGFWVERLIIFCHSSWWFCGFCFVFSVLFVGFIQSFSFPACFLRK